MPSIVQRTLTITTGKRASIKLDQPTWQAVEFLARERGQTWQEWCKQVLVGVSGDDNMTASVREAAMAGLLGATIMPDLQDRAEQLALQENHALMRNAAPIDDKLLNSTLKHAKVQGGSDFGGFEVLFGFDEHGTDCIWIKNRIAGGLHFAIQAPLN
ncbi:ribbon-helix-helix domain-containing protein [Massilia sp. TW-1]|uniref:Ribbon-helix-helix domain-containing protein n=1 Tax=Telluria antibiotica TaxID=2717319 RepID=A0ABX0PC95_9BURK|nr:ribbon-helix-helix domain-containing protein [Telluria antibiotica]NIA54856.1 ribbon-helix-helix domain-containing protein [Telluria antibiotica]